MIYYAALRPTALLANVRYKWTFASGESDEQSTGISQPTTFPLFRISAEAPVNAEELLVYDVTDPTNWTTTNAK